MLFVIYLADPDFLHCRTMPDTLFMSYTDDCRYKATEKTQLHRRTVNMKDTTPKNIVNLTDYKSNMNTNTENIASLELLKECRNLMTDRLSQALTVMLDKTDDVLFDMVQKSDSSDHRFYFNAMREVRLKRTSIETGFRENFSDLFNSLINVDSGSNQESIVLSGLDKEVDIEESIAISSTVGKVKHDCHNALLTLDQRMGELLNGISVERKQNPIRPETVCNAFQEACQNVESGIEIKLVLFKLFEKYVAAGLQEIYTDIDTLLTEKRISTQNKQTSGTGNFYQEKPQDGAQSSLRQNTGIIKDKNFFITANRVIRQEISKHLGKGILPEFVRDFLFNHWSKLMLKIYIKEGRESMAWLHALDVIDDLVHCVGSETTIAEKMNLAKVMPNLLQRLKYGMNVIPVTPALREEFIAELRQYHKDMLDKASENSEKTSKASGEDITVPSFRSSGGKIPFTDELLVDNKPGLKKDFDSE